MRNRPWRSAGVSRARWERAHRAVVGLVAELVWQAREQKSDPRQDLEEPMECLAGIGRGDPESTRYGLDRADAEPQDGEPPTSGAV